MSTIYLFANQKYGKKFIESACAYRKNNNTDICLIISGKGYKRSSGLFDCFKYLVKAKLTELTLARTYGMPVKVVEDINDFRFIRRIKKNHIGIVAGFNQIFKSELIEKFQTVVNFHPSLLPYYRGPVPSYWCLKNGEKYTGFTLHKITESVDSGIILYQDLVSIPVGVDEETLDLSISHKASVVMTEYISAYMNGKEFVQKKIDANYYYSSHPDYLSFPQLKGQKC